MKSLWKSWTFWFVAAAILGIVLNLSGIDDIGLYIACNPVLFWFSSTWWIRDWINRIPGCWYICSFVTMSLYGLWFDFLRSVKK